MKIYQNKKPEHVNHFQFFHHFLIDFFPVMHIILKMRLSVKISISLILLWLAVPCLPNDIPIDLNMLEFYAKEGFSIEWTKKIPGDNSWKKIAPDEKGRPIRISEIGLPGVPVRKFLSLKDYKASEFTLAAEFSLDSKEVAAKKILGLNLNQIGDCWQIYLNGHLLRDEFHISSEGKIEHHSSYTNEIIIIPPFFLNEGKNTLAFRIAGIPVNVSMGLTYSGNYSIDYYEKILKNNQEVLPLVLQGIYLFIGLYHIFLFTRRKKEKYNLYFGLFALFFSIYLFTRTSFSKSLITDSLLLQRIEFITVFSLLPLLSGFFDTILRSGRKKFTCIIGIFSALLIILTTFSSYMIIRDILKIWQISALVQILYMISGITILFIRIVRKKKGTGTLQRIKVSLINTVPGNIFLGSLLIALAAIFDIVNSLLFNMNFVLTNYFLIIMIMGMSFFLANKFQRTHNQIEILNIDLMNYIKELNEANTIINLSKERYRLIVDGSNIIYLTLDDNLKILSSNNAIKKHLKKSPGDVISKDFISMISFNDDTGRIILQQRLKQFLEEKTPFSFKALFFSSISTEPKEMQVRFEHISTEDKKEILAIISGVEEDRLLKFLKFENQGLEIDNYLISIEEILYRITRNLAKHMEQGEIDLARIALREMIINAIEHGNLNISFQEKSEALSNNTYFKLIDERRRIPENENKLVHIEFSINEEMAVYTIKDDGTGFDSDFFFNLDIDKTNKEMITHGRGIRMARNIFDEIEYNEKGNIVKLTKKFTGLIN